MKNTVLAAIVVIVVVIVIVASLAVILMRPSPSTASDMYTPNVVSAQDVGRSLGGTWSQKVGTAGVIHNYGGFESLINMSTGYGVGLNFAPAEFYSHTTLVPSMYSSIASGSTFLNSSSSTNYVFPVSSFELGIFAPSKMGFASVGYVQFTNSDYSTSIFNSIYQNVTNVSTTSYMTYRGDYNGSDFVYAWNSTMIGQGSNAHNYNLSVLVGLDKPYLIYIFYLVTGNESLQSFENLFSTQVSMVAQISSSVRSDFVSSSDLNTTLKSDYLQEIAAQVSISNASQMLNTIYSLEGYSSSYSSSVSQYSALVNQTIGNLTGLGLAAYLGNNSGNMSAVMVGYASFLSDNASLELFTLLEAYSHIHEITVNGYNALELNETVSVSGQTFSEGFIVVDYKNTLVSALVAGSLSLTMSQLSTIAQDQMSLMK